MLNQKSKRRKINFERNEILSLLVIFFLGFSTAMFSPYAPIWLARIFEVKSYFILGFVAIIPNFVILIGTTTWGIAADKFGNKPFVLTGILASGLMYFTLLFINNATIFLVVLLIGNIFISAQTSNFYSFATVSSSKKKEVILGEISAAFSLSWLIASPIAAFIHDNASRFSINSYSSIPFERIIRHEYLNPSNAIVSFAAGLSKVFSPEIANNPAQGVQLFIAVISCLIAFTIVIFTKDKRPAKKTVEEKKEFKESKLTDFKWIFALLMIIAFFQQATSGGFWAYASLYFIDTLHTPAIHFSYFLIATTGIGVVLALLLGRVVKIKAVVFTIIACTFIQVAIYVTIALFPTNSTVGLIVYSFPMYVTSSISLYSLVGSFSNKLRRSTSYGVYNTLGIAGSVSIVLFMGLSADKLPQGIMIMPIFAMITSFFPFLLSIALFFLFGRNKEIF